MMLRTFAVVGSPDSDEDFVENPERFRDFVLDRLRMNDVLRLNVKPVDDELAAHRGDDQIRSVEFSVIELYTPSGEFSILAQELETNIAVRINTGERVMYVLIND